MVITIVAHSVAIGQLFILTLSVHGIFILILLVVHSPLTTPDELVDIQSVESNKVSFSIRLIYSDQKERSSI